MLSEELESVAEMGHVMNIRKMLAGAAVTATLMLPVAPLAAQTNTGYVGTPPPTVGSTDQGRATQVAGVQVERNLAVTGGDVVGLAVLGVGAVGLGMALKRAGRRPEEA